MNHVYERYFENIRKCIIPRKGFGDGSKELDHKDPDPENVTITVKLLFVSTYSLLLILILIDIRKVTNIDWRKIKLSMIVFMYLFCLNFMY